MGLKISNEAKFLMVTFCKNSLDTKPINKESKKKYT